MRLLLLPSSISQTADHSKNPANSNQHTRHTHQHSKHSTLEGRLQQAAAAAASQSAAARGRGKGRGQHLGILEGPAACAWVLLHSPAEEGSQEAGCCIQVEEVLAVHTAAHTQHHSWEVVHHRVAGHRPGAARTQAGAGHTGAGCTAARAPAGGSRAGVGKLRAEVDNRQQVVGTPCHHSPWDSRVEVLPLCCC